MKTEIRVPLKWEEFVIDLEEQKSSLKSQYFGL